MKLADEQKDTFRRWLIGRGVAACNVCDVEMDVSSEVYAAIGLSTLHAGTAFEPRAAMLAARCPTCVRVSFYDAFAILPEVFGARFDPVAG